MEITGRIHSIETFSAVDGPGIRTVVFMQGCHLRCLYCHNPDTWTFQGQGKEYTVPQLFMQIKRYKSYWRNGGGVTISGGEPLCQPEFVAELLSLCRQNNIHTAIETTACVSAAALEAVLPHTDLVLLDIKHANSVSHQRITGQGNEIAMQNIDIISKHGNCVRVRYCLVPELTDQPDDILQLAKRLTKLPKLEGVEILPYHTLGNYKYEALGLDYPLAGTFPPDSECIERTRKIFASHNITVLGV